VVSAAVACATTTHAAGPVAHAADFSHLLLRHLRPPPLHAVAAVAVVARSVGFAIQVAAESSHAEFQNKTALVAALHYSRKVLRSCIRAADGGCCDSGSGALLFLFLLLFHRLRLGTALDHGLEVDHHLRQLHVLVLLAALLVLFLIRLFVVVLLRVLAPVLALVVVLLLVLLLLLASCCSLRCALYRQLLFGSLRDLLQACCLCLLHVEWVAATVAVVVVVVGVVVVVVSGL